MIWCHLLFWCHHPSLSSSAICQHSGVKHSLRGIDESKYKYNHAPVPYRNPPTRYRANGKYPHPFGHMLQWPESGRSTPNTGWLGPRPRSPRPVEGGGNSRRHPRSSSGSLQTDPDCLKRLMERAICYRRFLSGNRTIRIKMRLPVLGLGVGFGSGCFIPAPASTVLSSG